ncbi:hypothetical protein ACP70R_035752 [Stipagrostis hirtigluma subsp. patula]
MLLARITCCPKPPQPTIGNEDDTQQAILGITDWRVT